MRELFGDAVDDRRLPLVVLGDDLPAARRNRGASYDLAPSVLDLLGVQSNARFILGRSLLADTRRPDWLISRYFDVAAAQRIENNPARCEGAAGQTMPPFDACGKKALIGTLAGIANRYSLTPAQLGCTPARPTRFAFPDNPQGPGFEALVGGVDQSNRFSRDGYAVPIGSAGIYALVFGPHGRLRRTRFVNRQLRPGSATRSHPAAAASTHAAHDRCRRHADTARTRVGAGWHPAGSRRCLAADRGSATAGTRQTGRRLALARPAVPGRILGPRHLQRPLSDGGLRHPRTMAPT